MRNLLLTCGLLLAIRPGGCGEARGKTVYEYRYGQKLPDSVWGDANNIHYDVKYEFDYKGKRFVFTHPVKFSTDSGQGSQQKVSYLRVVSTYSQWVEMGGTTDEVVYLIRNELGSRFCVVTRHYPTVHYVDIQTKEEMAELKAVETVEIVAKPCKPEEQSPNYRRALALQKQYPIPEHMID
jgi:hypothetical protein